MWNVLPADWVTWTDASARASGAACSTTLVSVSAVRIVGWDRVTRSCGIGVSALQPFGARVQPIVFQDCWLATSSTTDAPNIDIVSPPSAGAGEEDDGAACDVSLSAGP